MYLKSVDAGSSKTKLVHKKFGEHWEVSIVPSVQGQFQQVSNSILYITNTHVLFVIHFVCSFTHSFPSSPKIIATIIIR